jgi:peptidyl-prolyl cis-trans isomerase A (cyclophilin A)
VLAIALPAKAAETINLLMKTSAGDITLELYPEAAPITVANFLRYVDGGYYDSGSFYRVVRLDNQAQNNIKIEVVQGGLMPDENGGPFPSIIHETTEDTGILHTDGVISMARSEPGSATSEFFICINDQPELDFGGMRNPDGQGFATFGKVTSGMDVVRQIQAMPTDTPEAVLEYTSGQILLQPVSIESIVRMDGTDDVTP